MNKPRRAATVRAWGGAYLEKRMNYITSAKPAESQSIAKHDVSGKKSPIKPNNKTKHGVNLESAEFDTLEQAKAFVCQVFEGGAV